MDIDEDVKLLAACNARLVEDIDTSASSNGSVLMGFHLQKTQVSKNELIFFCLINRAIILYQQAHQFDRVWHDIYTIAFPIKQANKHRDTAKDLPKLQIQKY